MSALLEGQLLPYLTRYFIGKQNIGSAKDLLCSKPNFHNAYFCPKCGEIWARALVMACDLSWTVTYRYCHHHGDGTLLFPVQYEYVYGHGELNRDISLSLLVHEFLALMRKKHG